MLDVGHWKTRFQDNEQTFYVTQKSVDVTHSDKWNPDSRAQDKEPYEAKDIGMAEWGVRHTMRPTADNRGWRTPYRSVNGAAIPGFALAVSIMQRRKEWNHDAYLDYAVKLVESEIPDFPEHAQKSHPCRRSVQSKSRVTRQNACLTRRFSSR